jgi:hypothetical protein
MLVLREADADEPLRSPGEPASERFLEGEGIKGVETAD